MSTGIGRCPVCHGIGSVGTAPNQAMCGYCGGVGLNPEQTPPLPVCWHRAWTAGCVPCQTRHLSPEQSAEYAAQTRRLEAQA